MLLNRDGLVKLQLRFVANSPNYACADHLNHYVRFGRSSVVYTLNTTLEVKLENDFDDQYLDQPSGMDRAYTQNNAALLKYFRNAYQGLAFGSEASIAFCDWVAFDRDRLKMNWVPPWDDDNPANYSDWKMRAQYLTSESWQTLGDDLDMLISRAGDDASIAGEVLRKISDCFNLSFIENSLLELITRLDADFSVGALFCYLASSPRNHQPPRFNTAFALLLAVSEPEINAAFQRQEKLISHGLLVISRNTEVGHKSTLVDLVRRNELIQYGGPPEPAPLEIPGDWPDWDC